MAIEHNDDGNENPERESVVSHGFVGLVESVRLGKFMLVVHQSQLLARAEHRVFMFFGHIAKFDVGVLFGLRWEVILVLQVWQTALSTDLPRQKRVMRDETHMICIDCTERS